MSTSLTNAIAGSTERAYSIEQAAELLALSSWTIRKWIQQKRIATCKLGTRRVVPASEITRILSESRIEREK